MDLSNYKKVEHEDGRIELIPKKESEYLTVEQAVKLQKESNSLYFKRGNMLVGNSGIQSVINLDMRLDDVTSEEPFKIFINNEYDLEYVEDTPSGAKQYIFRKKKYRVTF